MTADEFDDGPDYSEPGWFLDPAHEGLFYCTAPLGDDDTCDENGQAIRHTSHGTKLWIGDALCQKHLSEYGITRKSEAVS